MAGKREKPEEIVSKLRRAFVKSFDILPTDYRRHFGKREPTLSITDEEKTPDIENWIRNGS